MMCYTRKVTQRRSGEVDAELVYRGPFQALCAEMVPYCPSFYKNIIR